MKKLRNYREKGITLVALVITIIILLILVGVTLNTALNENGLFKRAKASAEKYNLESEKEALSMSVTSYQTAKAFNEVEQEKNRLGETLKKRDFQNTLDWHVVEVNDTTYGNGWNLVEKGTEIEGYGKAKNSWLINYETGEVIQLEENNYLSLSAGDMIAVKDNLIINVDSSIIDKGTEQSKEEIEKQLGGGITLEGFNFENENSGLTSTSFNFDGVDDYIKVPYDSKEQKETLAKNGFTFEFYGKWEEGENNYSGLFCYWNGNENIQAIMRFGLADKGNQILWNAGGLNIISDFSGLTGDPWNIYYKVENKEKLKEGSYITITLDTSSSYRVDKENYKNCYETNFGEKSGEFYTQKVYIDGELVYDGDYNKEQWDDFINKYLSNLKYFCIGRSSMSDDGSWWYSKMNAYCLRLYSRGLTEEEVRANYEKATKYHSLLESE